MGDRRNYDQNCPIATGLDVLGERWTLLILRELLGGPRRYSDLRAALPGIATNLLAARLRELEEARVIERSELPPPAARTVYTLSDSGWQQIPPILQALARFGLPMLPPPVEGEDTSALNGFLAGILLGFDPSRTGPMDTTYRADIDGRSFDFAVRDSGLGPARGEPKVTLTATAADLVRFRLASDPQTRQRSAGRIQLDGGRRATTQFRNVFALDAP
ncbi:helix-turn-helix transcriptional regulator [Rhodococcus opacus]|nr:helix-turn-helix transcriptional regulator [Rhodococcus opacus]